MEKINWKKKLSSRKFWIAIIGFISAIMYHFGVADATVESIVSIIGALAVLVAYILAEGFIDGKREHKGGDTFNTIYPSGILECEKDIEEE